MYLRSLHISSSFAILNIWSISVPNVPGLQQCFKVQVKQKTRQWRLAFLHNFAPPLLVQLLLITGQYSTMTVLCITTDVLEDSTSSSCCFKKPRHNYYILVGGPGWHFARHQA
mmetsp:Transcript_53327/g.113989  ORF Transcript_53327/g.113989 Transcript_53327/m.113989 type:complete len:113 (-) Transcript_53327:295-633(-)